ncbi:cysteine--1-D-myo-inosityl 2-amino-2-deoxy-alpha-D-glucopyranoside ligase [Nocardioides bruguierae]|uniref:L-cysteine:1D-myo-inositol 2-amino-2-deoxy-alpha-D-glucopyranoside ligase n=1 Tax=Nocardioides bruguierae TaxID=2945102 RepID=A0A9X2IDF3_9ACTN|nr:cysteine--1-D-myo-inosityl 2-amino-2-deoxy-alpha-D-glucopyranoside ligase [Nocardioides bruguierae]MCM0618968.1 cysteine--1-D-myo-inosityl 2-amino-2-deoxy-alpha-D-glucopyranoside ligase [Nocardioides bruguierae]
MRAWSAPDVPTTPVAPAVSLHDTATAGRVELVPDGPARLYVCGITPYDATHMGHASTYVAFDLLNRAWRSAGHAVTYVQNVTDVDDPLLERADRDDIEWTALAERETELFRGDMEALRVLPPDTYMGAVESIPLVIALIERLQELGAVYQVETDLYFSVTADGAFGEESGFSRETMLEIFPQRGGDPDRAGKKDPLDALLWRGERPGEPAWPSPFGPGRPGWHIECAAIALEHLGATFDVQGGGSDLVFPHHEMCASHVQVAAAAPFAKAYGHAGMVAYDGEKMSKSKGNLVFVSRLRAADVDPMAVRLTLLRHHYRSDWEWTDAELVRSLEQVDIWRRALALGAGAPTAPVVTGVLDALADDLDAPRAVALVDAWAEATLAGDTTDGDAAAVLAPVLDAALGVLV